MEGYLFKTQPFAHQLRAYYLQRDVPAFALPMDMGTGKTKVIIDTAGHLFLEGEIRGLVVVAPNDVHTNWITREIPKHLSDQVPVRMAYWRASPLKAERMKWQEALEYRDGLVVFAFNYEALASKRAADEAARILRKFPSLLVLDESHRIKTPGAKTTMTIRRRLAPLARYRRILSGTPFLNSPKDAYSQFAFLDPRIIGQRTFANFRARYAIEEFHCTRCHSQVDPRSPRCEQCGESKSYPSTVGYRNIQELRDRIKPYQFRARKDQCLDLPPKLYSRLEFALSPEQRRMIEEITQEGVVELERSSPFSQSVEETEAEFIWRVLTDKDTPKAIARHALTKIIRADQIASGFLLSQDKKYLWTAKDNPRIKALASILDSLSGKAIIWCQFIQEITLITELLCQREIPFVAFHGGIDSREKQAAVDAFQEEGGPRIFIGTAAAGGTGLTLTAASTMIYFSNTTNPAHRWQSEDRAHRIGQDKKLTIVDLIGQGTWDLLKLKRFETKGEMAAFLLGDQDNDPFSEELPGAQGPIMEEEEIPIFLRT